MCIHSTDDRVFRAVFKMLSIAIFSISQVCEIAKTSYRSHCCNQEDLGGLLTDIFPKLYTDVTMYKTVTELSQTTTCHDVSLEYINTFKVNLWDFELLHFGMSQGVSVNMSNGHQFTGSRDLNPEYIAGTCIEVCKLFGERTGITCDPTAYKSVFKLNIKLMSSEWDAKKGQILNELIYMGYTINVTHQESHSNRRSLGPFDTLITTATTEHEEVDVLFNTLFMFTDCIYGRTEGLCNRRPGFARPFDEIVKQAQYSAKDWEEEPEEEAEGGNKNKESSADSAKKRPPEGDDDTQIPRPFSPKDKGFSVDKVIRDKFPISISQLRQWGYPDAEIIPLFSMSFLQQDVGNGGIGLQNIPMACEKYSDSHLPPACPSPCCFYKHLGYSPAQIAGWKHFPYDPAPKLLSWGYNKTDVIEYIKRNKMYHPDQKRVYVESLDVHLLRPMHTDFE